MKKINLLFLSLLFLLPSIMFGQNVIQLEQGTNRLDDTLFVAQPGDIIELTTNGGVYYEYFSVLIDMPITIRAAEGLTTKPKIVTDDTRAIFTVRDDLTLIGLDLSGLGGEALTGSGVRTDSMDVKDDYNLTIEDCYFHDFPSSAIKANTNTIADNVTINNSIFFNIGIAESDEGIYFKNGEREPGSVRNFVCENSTFWNMGAEAIYVEDHDNDIATPGPNFLVNNITINNTTDKTIYPKGIDGAILKNFIVTNDEFNDAINPCRIYGTSSVAEYLLTYNIDKVSLKDDATVDSNKILHNTDPMFLDMSQGNFTLDATSPAVGFGEDESTLGDSRWWPSTVSKIEIDGHFGDWAGLQPLDVTENDPAITDSADIKAVWVAIDDDKISFRWDFFENVNFRSGETSGDWNMNQGWHRTYFEGNKNGVDMYCRTRSYLGDKSGRLGDSTSFSMLRWDPKSDSLGYDRDEFDGEYFFGAMAWNEEGTSAELFVLLDSLYYLDEGGNEIARLTKDDSLSIWFVNNSKDVYMPAGPTGSKLEESDNVYKILLSDYYVGETTIVSVNEKGSGSSIPEEFSLDQNYPNPFNPSTTINFRVPSTSHITLKVYNMLGQEVTTLVNNEMNAGVHNVKFDASVLSSGVYFYTMKAGDFVSSKKMMLVK